MDKTVFAQMLNSIDRSRNHDRPSVLVLLPPCTPEVEELLIRQFSFFSESVQKIVNWNEITDPFQADSEDVWIAPVIQADANTSLLQHQKRESQSEIVYWYQTALGLENVYVQKYTKVLFELEIVTLSFQKGIW